jgi:mannose-6-phosphate isomerase
MKLERKYVEKPWGRDELPAMFDAPASKRIGEVWFTGAGDKPLLVKYLFTSERLSIQVHPSDEEARARRLCRGKSECWYILDAEPDATLGIGLNQQLSASALRAAALDGSIEKLMHWHRVRAGDFFLIPPGTIHAIGGGISLLEFQQNSDATYRLYDYGRPRELHIEDAVAVANASPYPASLRQHLSPEEQRMLVDGPAFVLLHTCQDALHQSERWVIPLEGEIRSNGDHALPGECLFVPAGATVECDGRMFIGASA